MLYREYRAFMAAMAADRKVECRILDEEKFNAWMRGLEPRVRESVADDFKRGYWATVAQNKESAMNYDEHLQGAEAVPADPAPKPWSKKPVIPADAPFTCTLCGATGHIAKICPHNKAFRVIAGLDK